MKYTDPLLDCPVGEHLIVPPRTNETAEAAFKRLKRLARSYRKRGRSFRVEKKSDGILWWRVEFGKNSKLARWYAVSSGQSFIMKDQADASDLAKAKATARHLRRKGEGVFTPCLIDGALTVRRADDHCEGEA